MRTRAAGERDRESSQKNLVTPVPLARSPDVHPSLEATLVGRLRAGDAGAFDALFEHYRPRVFSFLCRLTRRRELAEDLAQETFLRLAARARELTEDTRLGPWLFTVARHLWLSHGRHAAIEGEHLESLAFAGSAEASTATPHELAVASESQRRLEAALAALPEAHREVLLLVLVERLTPAEAAPVLGLTAEAVRQRLSRARTQLAAALAEPDPAARVPLVSRSRT
jgi:RNA polymerase sigma-70 factor (ECF subfamily)